MNTAVAESGSRPTAAAASGERRVFARLLWAVSLGILLGLFFGESVAPLRYVGDGFIRLLQVNVLPYLLGSLIFSLGSRGAAEMKLIARYGVALLLFVWGLTLLLGDEEQRRTMGAAGRKRAVARHSLADRALEIRGLYERVLDSAAG